MHQTLNSSLIYFDLISFRSSLLLKHQNNLKIFSLFFSVFLLTFIVVQFCFLRTIYCMKVCAFSPALRFDSESRKHLPANWLHPMIWLPDGQSAKGPGKQVDASETHLHISSLLSVYTH